MTQELKACPFCGGEAHIYTPPISIGDDITDVDWMRAQCTKCGASRGFARFHDHSRQSADFKRARAEVIAAWNTRIESGVVAELASALVECENALADYIPQLEARGAALYYGHKVLADARAALNKLEASK